MNTGKWWAGLGAALVPVAAVFALWPTFEPALDWFVKTSILILDRPVVQALIVSMAIGVMLSGFLPHLAPAKWQPSTTRLVTRLVCGGVTFASCYALLNPQDAAQQRYALVYCTLAWMASAQVWTTLSNLFYRVAPKPESLK